MRSIGGATLLLAGLLAAACQSAADKDPDEYHRLLDATVAPAVAPAPDEPLTLERAMAVANRLDEALAARGEDYVQALLARRRIAAAFLPTLDFDPSFTVADRPSGASGSSGTGISGGFVAHGDTLRRLEAPLDGGINLFRGFGDQADLRAAEAAIAQHQGLLLDLQESVLLGIGQAFYAVLRAEQAVDVLARTLELQQARLADIEQQLEHGLATRLAVAQTRAQVDATRVARVEAERDVRNGRATLALLVGLPVVPNPLVDALQVPGETAAEPGFETTATQRRQDLRAAADALEAARHGVDAALAAYYPSVTLDVTGFLYREHYADASKWDAILSVNLPVFSAGRIDADVRTAWSRLRQAALAESATRRQVLHDVQIAFVELETSRRRIHELEDELRADEEAARQAEAAFRAGLAVNLDLLTAQDAQKNAELALSGARFDRVVAWLALLRASGQLAERLQLAPPSEGAAKQEG